MRPTGTNLSKFCRSITRAVRSWNGLKIIWILNVSELSSDHVVYNTDCGNQVKAYVNDMSGYLDAANKENKRILDKCNLL